MRLCERLSGGRVAVPCQVRWAAQGILEVPRGFGGCLSPRQTWRIGPVTTAQTDCPEECKPDEARQGAESAPNPRAESAPNLRSGQIAAAMTEAGWRSYTARTPAPPRQCRLLTTTTHAAHTLEPRKATASGSALTSVVPLRKKPAQAKPQRDRPALCVRATPNRRITKRVGRASEVGAVH